MAELFTSAVDAVLDALPLILAALAGGLTANALCQWRRRYGKARRELVNYRALIDNLSEGIYRSSMDGRQISANPALVRLNGYHSEAEMLANVKDIATEWYVDPQRREKFRHILMRDGTVENFVSEIYRHKTRERIWITESARLVCHSRNGKPLYYEGSVREITQTVERLKFEELFQKLTRQVPGGLFQLERMSGGAYSLPFTSSGFRTLIKLGEDAAMPAPNDFTALIHAQDRERFAQSLRESGVHMKQWDCEFRTQSTAGFIGKERWLRVTARPEAIVGGIIWHGYLSDISVRKQHEVEIEKLAFFDPLTELPNRRMLVEGARRALTRCARSGDCGALLFIDLDNFKTLNDTMGHDTGDRLLRLVAERVRDAVGASDLVARIGGDEFVVLLDTRGQNSAAAHQAALLAGGRVLSELRRSFVLDQLQHTSSASVGVVVFDGKESDVEEIMKAADMAMYKAKAEGRNGLALFDPQALREETDRFRLIADLREAIGNRALEMHYQPLVDASGAVRAAEALLRWNHPLRGMIAPDRFVPLTEQFGLAEDVARLVLTEAALTLKRWQDDPVTCRLNLAINVSVQVVTSTRFEAMLAEVIASTGIDAGKLTLEVTEHVMARDKDLMERSMRAFKRIGVRLSLDDFGTGYSSLAYLKSLPFDELKIDGSFVAEIEKAQTGRTLVKTIIAMARTLSMTVVAEHVETARQEAFLRALGCDFYQGWFYGRAMTRDAFEAHVGAAFATPGTQTPAAAEMRRLA